MQEVASIYDRELAQTDAFCFYFIDKLHTIMNQVSKTYFEPLASTKGQVRQLLGGLPLGSAHPFSPEKILLCKVDNGIKEIDISSHSEDFFFGSQDLGEMEEVMQKRMDRHSLRLSTRSQN